MLSRLIKLAYSKISIILVDTNKNFDYLVALMFKKKEFKINKMANRNMKTLGNLIEADYPSKMRSIFRLFCFLHSYFRNNLKFKHFTVFDSHNFVDLDTGTLTQNIESLRSKFKQFRRSKGYNKR
ncbi:hypothetical protein H311_01414 [Anncaliia algerae PRA109]|nr:hypothetical protein H311_01414 [Anncaliia algerae PRA109]